MLVRESDRSDAANDSPPARVTCLIVDDREENVLALSSLLRSEGVDVVHATSGAEALDLLLARDVALALLDVQMPEMDGFELAELMRGSERTRHVPIIFVTAGSHDQRRLFKGYDSGAVDFLYKPIDPHILKNKADVFFQLYRQKQQLARQLRERTETLRLNEMFTAVLGHDLRQPLNVLLAGAQLLERQADSDAVKRTAARMTSSARRMSQLIEDILDLARARLAGGIPLNRQPTRLDLLLHGVIDEYGAMAPGRLRLQASGDASGVWDAARLTQAVSNLIGNALQHGDPAGDVTASVDGEASGQVTLTVHNRGRIEADLLAHLFDPFRGAEREAGRARGLGLGLYIVQQIVRAHDGDIAVQSNEAGTTFAVTLPRSGGRRPS